MRVVLTLLILVSVSGYGSSVEKKYLHLQECIDIALDNNRSRAAARTNVEIARSQLRQAHSAFWPQLKIGAVYSRMDENPNFVFPASTMRIPPMTMTFAENFLFPGFPS